MFKWVQKLQKICCFQQKFGFSTAPNLHKTFTTSWFLMIITYLHYLGKFNDYNSFPLSCYSYSSIVINYTIKIDWIASKSAELLRIWWNLPQVKIFHEICHQNLSQPSAWTGLYTVIKEGPRCCNYSLKITKSYSLLTWTHRTHKIFNLLSKIPYLWLFSH